ncbi:MAG: hypothetical protein Tsb0021_17280 [Chlamydiales bacterium]
MNRIVYGNNDPHQRSFGENPQSEAEQYLNSIHIERMIFKSAYLNLKEIYENNTNDPLVICPISRQLHEKVILILDVHCLSKFIDQKIINTVKSCLFLEKSKDASEEPGFQNIPLEQTEVSFLDTVLSIQMIFSKNISVLIDTKSTYRIRIGSKPLQEFAFLNVRSLKNKNYTSELLPSVFFNQVLLGLNPIPKSILNELSAKYHYQLDIKNVKMLSYATYEELPYPIMNEDSDPVILINTLFKNPNIRIVLSVPIRLGLGDKNSAEEYIKGQLYLKFFSGNEEVLLLSRQLFPTSVSISSVPYHFEHKKSKSLYSSQLNIALDLKNPFEQTDLSYYHEIRLGDNVLKRFIVCNNLLNENYYNSTENFLRDYIRYDYFSGGKYDRLRRLPQSEMEEIVTKYQTKLGVSPAKKIRQEEPNIKNLTIPDSRSQENRILPPLQENRILPPLFYNPKESIYTISEPRLHSGEVDNEFLDKVNSILHLTRLKPIEEQNLANKTVELRFKISGTWSEINEKKFKESLYLENLLNATKYEIDFFVKNFWLKREFGNLLLHLEWNEHHAMLVDDPFCLMFGNITICKIN